MIESNDSKCPKCGNKNYPFTSYADQDGSEGSVYSCCGITYYVKLKAKLKD